jgi:hypothetical protein
VGQLAELRIYRRDLRERRRELQRLRYDVLPMIAGCILAAVAKRALAHQAQGRTLQVFTEFAPGRWGR